MLADLPRSMRPIGTLSGDIPKPASFRLELVEFVASALPVWRDRSDRPHQTSETALTSQICAHLNGTARHAKGWDILQFRVEEPDEAQAGRKIDLIVSPSGTIIVIEGRKHSDFDMLMPIECKRLPTPGGAGRDEWEYVIHRNATTGGMQRFKCGLHGAMHEVAAIIGYIQERDCAYWGESIGSWISQLIGVVPGWSKEDMPSLLSKDTGLRTAVLHSRHERPNGLPPISLHHLWVELT
jgi:hypothetical protein